MWHSLKMHWDSFVSVCIAVMPQSGPSNQIIHVFIYRRKVSVFVIKLPQCSHTCFWLLSHSFPSISGKYFIWDDNVVPHPRTWSPNYLNSHSAFRPLHHHLIPFRVIYCPPSLSHLFSSFLHARAETTLFKNTDELTSREKIERKRQREEEKRWDEKRKTSRFSHTR